MASNTYNGWTNYATWRVNLELCDDITSGLTGEQTFESVEDLAEYLESEADEWVDMMVPGDGTGEAILKGWVNAFLEDVDWLEIARSNADELVRTED